MLRPINLHLPLITHQTPLPHISPRRRRLVIAWVREDHEWFRGAAVEAAGAEQAAVHVYAGDELGEWEEGGEGGGAALAVSEDGNVGGGEGGAGVVWEWVGEGVEDDLVVLHDYVDGVGVGGAGDDGGVGWVLDGAGGERDDFCLAGDVERDDGVAVVGGDGGGEDVLETLVGC